MMGRETIMRLPAAILAAFLITLAKADDAPPLETFTVEMARAPLERIHDGTVEAVHQATMSSQTSGRIAEVFFDVDDFVEPGQPIIRFTDTEQQASLRRAGAALEEALARQKQAEDEFHRKDELFRSGSSSKREYDEAVAARDASVARVTAARASADAAKQQLEYTLVRAPYAGIVTARHVEVGEAVTVGQPLMSGLSLEALRVVVDIPQQVAAMVREDRQAFVLTGEGRVEATSVTIFPYAHSASNTFRVRLDLPQGQFDLYPGMFVKVAFVVGESRRLLVPTSALVRRSEVTGVYVVDEDGNVRMRQVRVGGEFGERTEVLSGLRDGEQVAEDPVRAAIHVKTMSVRNDDH